MASWTPPDSPLQRANLIRPRLKQAGSARRPGLEGIFQRNRHIVGMEVARQRRADKVLFAVLIVVVSQVPGQIVSDADIHIRQRLIVVIGQTALRLQDIELRNRAATSAPCRGTANLLSLSAQSAAGTSRRKDVSKLSKCKTSEADNADRRTKNFG